MIQQAAREWSGGSESFRFVDTGHMSVQVFDAGNLAGKAFITCESEAFDDELTPEQARNIIQLLTEWLDGEES